MNKNFLVTNNNKLKDIQVKRKFLFVSYDGLISDTAWQVIKEGHEAKYYIKNPNYKEVGDGFIPKISDWKG
ncbi:hypothetical protein ISS05_04565, partial [Candidatus Woesearchaeota archaeon]|nr:hypothetical protein [Candidatus Woesearchaeota archaeon]